MTICCYKTPGGSATRQQVAVLLNTRWQCYKTPGGSATRHQVAVLQDTRWQCYMTPGGSVTSQQVAVLLDTRWQCYKTPGGSATSQQVAVLQNTRWQCYKTLSGSATRHQMAVPQDTTWQHNATRYLLLAQCHKRPFFTLTRPLADSMTSQYIFWAESSKTDCFVIWCLQGFYGICRTTSCGTFGGSARRHQVVKYH